jgi:hypothetical protein
MANHQKLLDADDEDGDGGSSPLSEPVPTPQKARASPARTRRPPVPLKKNGDVISILIIHS